MTTNELRTEMVDGFNHVADEFKNVRAAMENEFKNVRAEMQDEFTNVRADMADGFTQIRAEMVTEFKNVRAEMAEIRADIKAEGQTTRRHFDLMVEKMNDSVKIVAEATAHHAVHRRSRRQD